MAPNPPGPLFDTSPRPCLLSYTLSTIDWPTSNLSPFGNTQPFVILLTLKWFFPLFKMLLNDLRRALENKTKRWWWWMLSHHCFLNCKRAKGVWSAFSPTLSALMSSPFSANVKTVFFYLWTSINAKSDRLARFIVKTILYSIWFFRN